MSKCSNVKNKITTSFQGKKFKNGAYSSITMVVILVIVVFFNLVVSKFDWKIDLSNDGMYTLTSDTKKIADKLKDDITIYYICENGNETTQIEEIVNKYKKLSSHLKVVEKDPVVYPNFTKKYVDSNETVADNSIIVVSEKENRSKYIPYDDMLVYDSNDYYSSGVTAVDVEGQITSAIQYVTATNLPKMYNVTGHGEAELGSTMQSSIAKQNIEVKEFKTLSATKVPKDCDILLINGPTSEFSEDEIAMIKKYLNNGGKALFLTAYTTNNMDNFYGLINYYGVKVQDGIVIEDSEHSVGGYQQYALPTVESTDITDGISNAVVMPAAQGLTEVKKKRSTLDITKILTSSDNAYAVTDVSSSTLKKSDKDIEGPFDLGVLITEMNNKKTTRLAVFSTNYMIDENNVNMGSVGNDELF